MKKIAFLTKSTMRYDSRVKKIASSLSKNNYEVYVIAEKLYKDLKKEEKREFNIYRVFTLSGIYSVESSVTIENEELNLQSNKKKKIVNFIKHIKFRIYVTKFLNRIFWNLGALLKIIKLKPDLIINRDPDSLLTAYIASFILQKPIIYEPHEIWSSSNLYLRSSRLMQKYWDWVENTFIKKVDLIFTTTESKRKILMNLYGITNIHVLRSTCPFIVLKHTKNLKTDYNIPANKLLLIYQGQIGKIRGVFDIVDAVKDLNDFILIFMGMGNDINELIQYVKSLGLENKVLFKDAVSPEDIVENIASADIGIQPFHYSENIYNEISNKLLECIMAEIPVIGVNFPEIASIINDNNIGYVYESGNVEQLKDILKTIEKNREVLDIFKENCKKIKRNYSWEVEEKILLEEVGKLI